MALNRKKKILLYELNLKVSEKKNILSIYKMNKSEISASEMAKLRNAKLKLVRKEIGVGRGRPKKATKGGGFTRAELNAMRDALLKTVKKELKIKPTSQGLVRKAGRPKKNKNK